MKLENKYDFQFRVIRLCTFSLALQETNSNSFHVEESINRATKDDSGSIPTASDVQETPSNASGTILSGVLRPWQAVVIRPRSAVSVEKLN